MAPQIKPIQLIKANRLFEHVSENELKLTVNKPDLLNIKEGEIIFRIGEAADQIYLILEGEVKVKQTIPNDVPRIFLKNKNDFLGEKEFLENKSRASSAVADKDCMLYVLRRKEVNDLVSRNRKIWSNLQGESPIVEFENDSSEAQADVAYEDFKKTRDEIREIMGLSGFEDPSENPEDFLVKARTIEIEEEKKLKKDTLHFLKHTTLKFSDTEGINGKSKTDAKSMNDSFEQVLPSLPEPEEDQEFEQSSFESSEESSTDEFKITEEEISLPQIEPEVESPKLNLDFLDDSLKQTDEETKFNFGSFGRDTAERTPVLPADEPRTTTEKFKWDFTPSSEEETPTDESKSESTEELDNAWNFAPSSQSEEKVDSSEVEKEEVESSEEDISWNFVPSSEAVKTTIEDKVKFPVHFDDVPPEEEKLDWDFNKTKAEEEFPSIKEKFSDEAEEDSTEEKSVSEDEGFSWDFSSPQKLESTEEKAEQPKINFQFEDFSSSNLKEPLPEAEDVHEEDDEILQAKEEEKVKLNLDVLKSKDEEILGAGFEGLKIPEIAEEKKFTFDSDTAFTKEKNLDEKKATFEEIIKQHKDTDATHRSLSAEQLNLLISCTQSVNSTFKIDEVLRSIIDAATTLARADRGTLYIIDQEKHELWSKIVRGDNIEEIRLNIGVGLAGWVALAGETVNIVDVTKDERFNPEYDKISGYKTRSMICFPIKNKVGMVVGVLQLINSLNGRFTEIDEDFLEALSIHAAIALEKAELFEQTLKTDRLTSLGKVSTFIIGDIKKPILTIKHFAEHIKKKNITPDVRQVLDMIIQQTNGIINLVQTTLSYSEGKTILRTKVQSMNKVMDEILDQVAEYVELRGVKLFKKFDKDVFVNVDRRELYQAIYQVTKNACDALPNGGNFYLSTSVTENEVEILLKDDGLGIPPSIVERVFEPFMSHGKKNGVGLGLCIAEKIVKEHEGKITLESELGEGTEVKIILPIVK